MKRQYNITQTSLQMEKKKITANSFHETSITLIPSTQKKKKKNTVKKENYWQISLMNLGSPTNIGSLKPAIYKRQSSWLHFLGYSLSCCNQKTSKHNGLKKTRYISLSHPDVNGSNLPSPTHLGLQQYFYQYFLSSGEEKNMYRTHGVAFKEMVI